MHPEASPEKHTRKYAINAGLKAAALFFASSVSPCAHLQDINNFVLSPEKVGMAHKCTIVTE